MEEKKCRRFLSLTFSNSSEFDHQFHSGPSGQNWPQSSLVYKDGICRTLPNCNWLTLHRWHSARTFAIDGRTHLTKHKFADLTFFEVNDSSAGEVPTNFRDENQNKSFQQFDCLEKGLYEELSSVKWEGERMDESDQSDQDMLTSDQYDREGDEQCSTEWGKNMIMGEENWKEELGESSGIILFGYLPNECYQTVGQFVSDWPNWSSVRALCATLPPKCAFRHLSFYRKHFGKCRYASILLVQVDNALSFVHPISNCINNAQTLSLSPNGVYIDLYQEIEFEIDLEVIQHLVETSKSINCVGRRLVVRFSSDAIPQIPLALYRNANFSPSSISSSFSTSSELNLNLTNDNYKSDEEASEFDVEMEEIMGKDENKNETEKQKKEGGKEEETDETNDNIKENGKKGQRRKWDNNNNRGWTTATGAASAGNGGTVNGAIYESAQGERGQLNIGKGTDQQETKCKGEKRKNCNSRGGRASEEGAGRGKGTTRQRGGFSLLKGTLGTVWRKITTKP